MPTLDAFPADDPVWNTDGTNRTTPTTGKQEDGWTVGEEPSSAFFNWWMFYVHEYVQHYKTSIVAINDAKLERDGSNTVTGNILPDANATRDLGSATFRYDDVFGDDVNTNGLTVNTAVKSDLIPDGDQTRNLGSAAFRWGSCFFATPTVDNMTVNTSMIPDAAGGAVVGTNALPFNTGIFRTVRSNDIRCYSDDAHPASADEQVRLDIGKSILACAFVNASVGAGAAIQADGEHNCASLTRTAAGNYTITFDQPVPDGATLLVTLGSGGSQATDGTEIDAEVITSGTQVRVSIWNVNPTAGIKARRDQDFHVLVLGKPRNYTTSPVL